ncbi:phage tail tube protein [Bosea sp. AS-1]|uniref:phage tail tube protein n=1 Tax=Bosea sp. AS-1 TaxID=2015316 RepID=UPI000B79463E|nr:phage tail tube protein [Bosea sp. AS-1]
MAQAQTFRWSGYRVLIGDGASPEVFSSPCGFTERSFSINRELAETLTPDCADEDAPAWMERDVTSQSATISGQGVLETTALPIWIGKLETTESFNARVELWRSGSKVGTWEGAFALETFETSGTRGERVTVNVTMQSDGAVTYTAAT